MGEVVSIASPTSVEIAWERYAMHRAQELRDPGLADDPAHVAESNRLHTAFAALYDDREPSAVVIPFRRRRG